MSGICSVCGNECKVGNKTCSKECRYRSVALKVSAARKGKKQTREHIEKRMVHHRGKKRSVETCERVRRAVQTRYDAGVLMGFKSFKMSPESHQKVSDALRGRPNPAQSERMKNNNPMKRESVSSRRRGENHPSRREEVRNRIKESMKGLFVGEKNPNWKGGITARKIINRKVVGSYTEREWEDLKKRHLYRCLCCGRFEPEIRLEKDHVVPISLGGLNIIENIQPLCVHCNRTKHAKVISYRRCWSRFDRRSPETSKIKLLRDKLVSLGLGVEFFDGLRLELGV